ncbi:MAG: TolC family outer membrane protein [Cypionkella sp.]
MDLVTAIATAVSTNPEVNQAVRNREAIEFERRQAQGLMLPQVWVEGSAGVRRLENASRRALNIADEVLYPLEGGIRTEQALFDGGSRSSEIKRQAARTDGAAFRVLERSQFVALQVARHYLDYLLQQRVVAVADDNVAFHEKLATDLAEGVRNGSISIADQQQAEERLQAARGRLTEARQDLTDTASVFRTLTGLDIDPSATMPPAVSAQLPATLAEAVDLARSANPRIREAQADLDAAYALVRKAQADLLPTISLEARARAGDDIDGFRGRSTDLNAGAVMRWNVFSGGINQARVNEARKRESEARYRLEQMTREAEEDMRVAWSASQSQAELLEQTERQSEISDDLLVSYREQFNVGRRSLLDVLDAQHTRQNVQVRTETARFARLFAEYKILAAASRLLEAVGVAPPAAATAGERDRFKVRPALRDDQQAARGEDLAGVEGPEEPIY